MAVRTTNLSYPRHVSEEIDLLSRALGGAYRVFLFADYGGTLVPHGDGDDPCPTDDLLRRLEQLSHVESFSLYVSSGRPIAELDELLGLDDVGLIGQSGFEIRKPGGETTHPVDVGGVGQLLQHIELEAHGCLCEHPEVEVVNTGYSISLKHGSCDCDTARSATHCFSGLVRSLDTHGQLEVLYNRRTVEARMAGWRKGDAVGHVLRDANIEDTLAIYIGDDVTDEEAFEALGAWSGDKADDSPWFIGDPDDDDDFVPRALPILVSPSPRPTTASLFVRGPHEVYEFLSSVTAIASALM
ncbi:MAG: trehalose-phosphatase [Candidatus Eisenbacteria bacterium]